MTRTAMPVIGYTDRISARAGETVEVKISCEFEHYDARLVRFGHDPDGERSQLPAIPVPCAAEGRHPGIEQPLVRGSWIEVDGFPEHALGTTWTIAAWVFATYRDERSRQPLVAAAASGHSLALELTADGRVAVTQDGVEVVASDRRLPLRAWVFVAASADGDHTRVQLWPARDPAPANHAAGPGCGLAAGTARTLRLAAGVGDGSGLRFTGKLEAPTVYDRALELDELTVVRDGRQVDGVVACWDFATDFAGTRVVDSGPLELHGRAVNGPTRAVTGHTWRGAEVAFHAAPDQYAAIHFHADDLEDAAWRTSHRLELDGELKSGVYAFHVSHGEHSDHIPIFVRPKRDAPPADVLVLLPTFSYLAYQNHHNGAVGEPAGPEQPEDVYSVEERILTLYERHLDGSGVCYASHLKPLGVPRPHYRSRYTGTDHQLSADLRFLEWLESSGIAYDVATDHDLHLEGVDALAPYRVVVTGSHPEYWSGSMLDALDGYQQRGGRFVCLGGNVLYWVTSMHPDRPHLVEVRRGIGGLRTWNSEPGESFNSQCGEPSGLWRHRGRPPQLLTGVGFTSWGEGPGKPYRRTAASFDRRAGFIFEGVADDALIGAQGSVLGGAASYEMDRASAALGTPEHALVVASADGFDGYHPVPEDLLISSFPLPAAVDDERIGSDIVFYETASGGAVFSAGSIGWTGSLAAGQRDPAVERITHNVLKRFSDPTPFRFPCGGNAE